MGSYVVLARKWRPQKFEDLIGQETVTRILKNAISLNRVPHAMLFTGTRGVGKTTSARIMAKALNCENSESAEPCGECSNCVEIAASHNVDVMEIDGASNTSVDDIRELKENVLYTPSKSKHKIYIIDEVHMLSTNAFNALLKTLEEPPDHVIFIFATTEPQKIPDTILSRCQRFDFREVSEEKIASHLMNISKQEKFGIDETAIWIIARQAQGSIRDSLSLMDQVIALAENPEQHISEKDVIEVLGLTDRALMDQTLEALCEHSVEKVLHVATSIFANGSDLKIYLLEVLERVRDMLVLKAGADPSIVKASDGLKARMQEWQKDLPEEELERWFEIFKRAVSDINRVQFPQYVVEVSLLQAARELPRISMQEIASRLEALQSGKPLAPIPTKTLSPKSSEPKPAMSQAEVSTTKPASGPPPQSVKSQIKADEAPLVAESPEQPESAEPAIDGEWTKILAAVKSAKPSYAAVLLQAKEPEVGQNELVLQFPKNSFYIEKSMEREFQDFVSKTGEEVLGRPVKLKVQEFQAQRESGPSVSEKRSQLEKEALSHPVVQTTMSLFDGKVEEVKPLKGQK